MKCEYDEIVLANYSDADTSPQEKRAIEKHMQKCESCRNRWQKVQQMEKPYAEMTSQEFVERAADKDLDIKKSTIEIDDGIVSAGGVNHESKGKVAISDSEIRGKRTIIAGGSVFTEVKTQREIHAQISTPASATSAVKCESEIPVTLHTPQQITEIKFAITSKCEQEYKKILDKWSQKWNSALSSHLQNKRYEVNICNEIEHAEKFDFILRCDWKMGFSLEMDISCVEDGEINKLGWVGMNSEMYEDFAERIPSMLGLLLTYTK